MNAGGRRGFGFGFGGGGGGGGGKGGGGDGVGIRLNEDLSTRFEDVERGGEESGDLIDSKNEKSRSVNKSLRARS